MAERNYNSHKDFFDHEFILFEKEGLEQERTSEKMGKGEFEKGIVGYLKEKNGLGGEETRVLIKKAE